ncbi:penicillin acylase family protein [Phenylobacterium sp.]|uniref:penicillin acylase family protein n=1 Tax=Phenylobacterium sp. TaxID=1871053 RepID=UPI002DEF08D2|nr:penicillin acylase family protein [Phenylobacterium sp.]
MRAFLLGVVLATLAGSVLAAPGELARQRAEAAQVRIVRDDWGIAHVHGHTDRQAVFGMAYAQAEDDFNRVEENYITALGRSAEEQGQSAIWQDLRIRLIVDPVELKTDYAKSPTWLKSLMQGWADGLNFYLADHPAVKPKVITHFEPWMALSFTEGSIGPDIERADLKSLQAFYGGQAVAALAAAPRFDDRTLEAGGSNGFAIAPSNTKDGHALLLINPHTSFFFRSELQMASDEGLDAYGAVTWGQFFIYQGFNRHAGWMHTSTGADVVDEFAETIVRKDGKLFYRYGAALKPVTVSEVVVRYRAADGAMASRRFTIYRTHHGPIVRADGDRWIAIALMHKPAPALEQSFLRTKAADYASFMKVAELKANSSNNTLFADDKGEIAYLHPQFIPRRDNRFDYTRPVDGSDRATDWQGPTPLAEAPHLLNPPSGFVFNSNDEPWNAAGPEASPRKADFPRYMDQAGENTRGLHDIAVLTGRKDFTLKSLMRTAYDPWLPGFAKLIPSLLAAYDATPASDPLKAKLAGQVAVLRGWDERWATDSVATSLAVLWGDQLWKGIPTSRAARLDTFEAVANGVPGHDKLQALAEVSDRLSADFGSWRTPWGEINRFQRIDDSITPHHDDAKPSIPVAFTSSQWGSLAAFGASRYPGTKRYYGYKGNSFVAVVEFGPKVRAYAVTAGGESGQPDNPHFADEAARYASGDLREVYFWPEQLAGHTERSYRPGE